METLAITGIYEKNSHHMFGSCIFICSSYFYFQNSGKYSFCLWSYITLSSYASFYDESWRA